MGRLRIGWKEYFAFYNGERPHQSLGFKTPDVVYRTATGGGAQIVDKYRLEPPTTRHHWGSDMQLRLNLKAQLKF